MTWVALFQAAFWVLIIYVVVAGMLLVAIGIANWLYNDDYDPDEEEPAFTDKPGLD